MCTSTSAGKTWDFDVDASTPSCPDGATCIDGGQNNRLVFVTNTTMNGNLGGLAGADTICNNLATAASLPGTYMAWLSDSTGSPSTRFTQSTVPYRLVDGTLIANDWADLIDGTLQNPISLTQTGGVAPGLVWTSTETDGTLTVPIRHCLDWSNGVAPNQATFGQTTVTGSGWTDFLPGACNSLRALYCFQQ